MNVRAFRRLVTLGEEGKHLCIGLDPGMAHVEKIFGLSTLALSQSSGVLFNWGLSLFRATEPYAAAYKANLAFWAHCPDMLRMLFSAIRDARPDIPLILDGKMGDIDNTGQAWANFADYIGATAVTNSPYMGVGDVTDPFEAEELDCFVLVKTSNPRAAELQDITFYQNGALTSLHEVVASMAVARNRGMVVGATNPDAFLQMARKVDGFTRAPLLIPGVGKQGGDVAAVVAALRNHEAPWVVNVGRGIAEPPRATNLDAWKSEVAVAAKHYHELLRPAA